MESTEGARLIDRVRRHGASSSVPGADRCLTSGYMHFYCSEFQRVCVGVRG